MRASRLKPMRNLREISDTKSTQFLPLMNAENAIAIPHDDEEEDDAQNERRSILEPGIRSVVEALGGLEDGVYRLGDECYGCLKDLKRYWRLDDTDDERTISRIFWSTRVLPNDLISILLVTAGRGQFEDKRAIACVDLMTAMTWPIDMAEELRELDEVADRGSDYTELLSCHLAYKAALLKPQVMQALFGIALACLAKNPKQRSDRDTQVVHVVLYLLRNLAFIKDLPVNLHLSSDQAEYSSLQTRFVKLLKESQIFELLITAASSAAAEPVFNACNTLILDIFYLLLRGVKPALLAVDQIKQPAKQLQQLLAVENGRKQNYARNASSRHSRFGTTISVSLNSKKLAAQKGADDEVSEEPPSTAKLVLHRQQAISRDAGALIDLTSSKKTRAQKTKKIDELARDDNLSLESKLALQDLAKKFIESCFNPLLESLLKDIRAERPKITEKDNLRLLYVTKWFLEFFQAQRVQEPNNQLAFGYVAEVTDRSWIVWVLKRMREAAEEKPKLWTELQAGIDCLTQLILLIDTMAISDDTEMADAAQTLQHQIIYNGEILDISLESVRVYKDGTQSLAYLDSCVHLAYSLLRMLEKWGKKGGSGEMYVRKKAKKAKRQRNVEGTEIPDVEEEEVQEEEEDIIHETMFTFDAFEQRFAHTDVTKTLLTYLARYKEFTSPESMKRVVNLLHRQAVRAKAEGLFFNVSTLDLFKSILSEQQALPRDQVHKDLIALINFVLRKFFKAVSDDSFVAVQAFFPKNRGHWKELSSWEPDTKTGKRDRAAVDPKFPPEVQVKKGYSWSQQLGIAIACLVGDGQRSLVDWVSQILMMVIGIKQRIVEDTDGSSSTAVDQADGLDINDDEALAKLSENGPSQDAVAKFTDYMIPYINNDQAEAACKNPHLKLMFRLVGFFVSEEDAEELQWFVPAAALPLVMQRSLSVINQFLENPIDLNGENPHKLLQKKRSRRRRRRRDPSNSGDEEGSDSDAPRKKKEKKKKEEKTYKSAQFIEDSDTDDVAMQDFFERERALRDRTALLAANTGKLPTMRPTGTKKRRKKNPDGNRKRKRDEADDQDDVEPGLGSGSDADSFDQADDQDDDMTEPQKKQAPASGNVEVPPPSRAKPKPRPLFRKSQAQRSGSAAPEKQGSDEEKSKSLEPTGGGGSDEDVVIQPDRLVKRKVIVISDDED